MPNKTTCCEWEGSWTGPVPLHSAQPSFPVTLCLLDISAIRKNISCLFFFFHKLCTIFGSHPRLLSDSLFSVWILWTMHLSFFVWLEFLLLLLLPQQTGWQDQSLAFPHFPLVTFRNNKQVDESYERLIFISGYNDWHVISQVITRGFICVGLPHSKSCEKSNHVYCRTWL